MSKFKSEILYQFQDSKDIYSLFNISLSSNNDDIYFGSSNFKNFHLSLHKDNSIWISPDKKTIIKPDRLFEGISLRSKSFTMVFSPARNSLRKLWKGKKSSTTNILLKFSPLDNIEDIILIFHFTKSKERLLESKLVEDVKVYPESKQDISDNNRIKFGKYYLEISVQGLIREGIHESIESMIILPPGIDPNSVYKNLKRVSIEKEYLQLLMQNKYDFLKAVFEDLYTLIIYKAE